MLVPPELRLGAITGVATLRRSADPVIVVIELAHKRSLRRKDATGATTRRFPRQDSGLPLRSDSVASCPGDRTIELRPTLIEITLAQAPAAVELMTRQERERLLTCRVHRAGAR